MGDGDTVTRTGGGRAYGRMARYYDLMYDFKNYPREVACLVELLGLDGSAKPSLLDIGCGTGRCLEILEKHFRVEGLDNSPEMLEVARERMHGTVFHPGDMTDFDLGREYDVVVCLFSSIGYVQTLEKLRSAVDCMVRHVAPGGVLVVEPWFTPETWHPGTVHGLFVDEPELKIARVSTSFTREGLSVFDLHYLVGTPAGTEHVVECHEMGLFTVAEMTSALEDSGLSVAYDPEGLTGRGLYLCRKLNP